MRRLFLSLLIASLLLCAVTATAQAKTPSLRSLAKTVAALQKKVVSQAKTIKTQTADLTSAKAAIASQAATIKTLDADLTSAKAAIASQAATISTQGQTVTTQGQTIGDLSTRLTAAETKLSSAASILAIAPYVSLHTEVMNYVKGPNIVFQGANVHVRSSSVENDNSGLGNLIVGWDDVPGGTLPNPFRTGTNNLVAGDYNNFTNYGCFVDGYLNSVSGLYSSVSGGGYSSASNQYASVSGGYRNTASGDSASATGGYYNVADGHYGSVSGGYHNYATGANSTVTGGQNNHATGGQSSISGGGYYDWATSTYYGLTLSTDSGWCAGNTAVNPSVPLVPKYQAP
jgi:hypothetical protein